MKQFTQIILFSLLAIAGTVVAQDRAILFREDFNDLDKWKPFFFSNIKNHSTYTVENNAEGYLLRTESSASASAVVYDAPFSAAEYPLVHWRWKVKNLYEQAHPDKKSGDDYPLRIYIMFEYDPHKAGLGDRIMYGLAKSRFGSYPPHSSLSYVWSSRATSERIFSSPYTDKAKMVVLRAGPEGVGAWQEETVNMIEDYRAAFGTDPPARARIAIMNDSDNTGESAVSWVDYIEVFK